MLDFADNIDIDYNVFWNATQAYVKLEDAILVYLLRGDRTLFNQIGVKGEEKRYVIAAIEHKHPDSIDLKKNWHMRSKHETFNKMIHSNKHM